MAGKTRSLIIGIALLMVLKALLYIFRVTIKTLASAIVFLGLYIPLFYSVFALLIFSFFGFDFEVMDTNMILMISGFGLSFFCALIIAVRNLIIRPFSSIFASFGREEFPTYQRVEHSYMQRRSLHSEPRYYDNDYHEEYDNKDYDYQTPRYDREPIVYYSEREPGLLIHEYEDRFEVFCDDGQRPKRYLRTEYK